MGAGDKQMLRGRVDEKKDLFWQIWHCFNLNDSNQHSFYFKFYAVQRGAILPMQVILGFHHS